LPWICSWPPATRPGTPPRSTRSAGTTPCSANTSRPSPAASRPSPCSRPTATAPGKAAAWDSLGYAHHHLGHHSLAVGCYEHALDLWRGLGDRYNESIALTHIGITHHTTGEPATARSAWQRALTILDDLNHPDAEQLRAKLLHLNRPDP